MIQNPDHSDQLDQSDYSDHLDPSDYSDLSDQFDHYPGAPRHRWIKAGHKPKRSRSEILAAIVEWGDPALGEDGLYFSPTLDATWQEKDWISEHLGPFWAGKQITGVLRRVKGGKEANVYCCAAHPATGLDLIAAKLYRPRKFRNLRNDSQYRQGRAILDGQGKVVRDWRMHKAIQSKSRKGLEAQQTSWLEYEFQTMQRLSQAGADVPLPVKRGDHTILMEYVGDEIIAAPALIQVSLAPDEARNLFERLMRNVEVMLGCSVIHGDLSAYNVLYWNGEVKIIDFPQVVDARGNPDAFVLFLRDVERLSQYFARYGVAANPAERTNDLWARFGPARTDETLGEWDEDSFE